ncbi:MAG: nodulation protein NfeD [Synergistaceae bacterium]|jgi:membrane-bound serine protease (ClpP class)|nr:nodulation protein NfeD [Synergistaceae bacterium]
MSTKMKSPTGLRHMVFLSSALLLFLAAALGLAGLVFCGPSPSSAAGSGHVVYIAPLDGVVGVPMEEFTDGVFDSIGDGQGSVLIFRMDTPGGLVDSMSRIMSRIADSNFPVVVWVGPGGARAASAGAFIAMSAHVTAMAPETNIGAAHPVTGSGGDIEESEMSRKVMNDLTAKMRAFARERNRNASVTESMVTDSVSLTAQEAFDQYVVELLAADEEELLAALDGMEVDVKGSAAVISTGGREIVRIEMPFRLRALEVFSRPDIAYLALVAGVLLIILEMRAPGGFVAGIFGGVLLIVAAYGLRMLPVNFAGAALLIGGVIVVVADIAIGGVGIMAVPGIIAMLFGGLILYKAPGGELLRMSYGFVVGVTAAAGAVFLLVLRLVYKALRRKPASGFDAMIGARVKVLASGAESGGTCMALVHGEYWSVSADEAEGELSPGDEVEVTGVRSMTLLVRRVDREYPREEI